MDSDKILYENRGHVARVTLNRPGVLNAFDEEMSFALDDALARARDDNDVWVVILNGSGPSFCAGQDLRASVGKDASERVSATAAIQRKGHLGWSAYNLYRFDKPLIAAVQGNCVGGGLGLALGCDVRIASADARFAAIFTKRGYVVDSGTSLLLPIIVGYPRAAELAFTSRFVDASEALAIGLVNRVVEPSKLEEAVDELAAEMARQAPVAARLSKRALRRPIDRDMLAAHELELYEVSINLKTDDMEEGRSAFLEKRAPRWKGV